MNRIFLYLNSPSMSRRRYAVSISAWSNQGSVMCCLLWTNRNSIAVISIFLSISLSNRDMNPSIGAISKRKYFIKVRLLNLYYIMWFTVHFPLFSLCMYCAAYSSCLKVGPILEINLSLQWSDDFVNISKLELNWLFVVFV